MSFDLSQLEPLILSRLGATAWTSLDWITESELYTYFEEAAKKLSEAGIFVDRDASQTLAAGQAQYPTPAGWISTVHASIDGTRLRPTSSPELEALDSSWQTEQGPADRYSMDAGPLGTITLFPVPSSVQQGETLAQIYHRFPADISATQTTAPVPASVADYFAYFALQRVRGKESEGAMPEMAAHFAERVKLYEQVIAQYWGEAK